MFKRGAREDRGRSVKEPQRASASSAFEIRLGALGLLGARQEVTIPRSSLESTIGIHREIWEIEEKTWLPDLPVHSGFM